MKPSKLGTPERDLGWAEIRPLAENLIQELERQAQKIQELERGRRSGEAPQPPGRLAEARRLLGNLGLRTADAVTLERQRVLQRAIDEDYFHIEMEPGVGIAVGGPSVVNPGPPGSEDFPAGVMTARRRTRRLRDLWPKTFARLNLWYTSPVASTNTFNIRYNMRQYDVGMLTSAAPVVFNVDFTPAGPAAANDILFATTIAPTAILPAPRVCQFTLSRQGPDANANAFRLLMAEIVLEERA